MSAVNLIFLIMELVFIALGIVAIVDYVHYRDSMRRDVALLFGILAVPFLFTTIAGIGQKVSDPLNYISLIALLLQPLLLLRLVRYLRSMPAYMMRLAVYSLIVIVIIGIIISPYFPAFATLLFLAYFIGFNLYAMVGFVRGALRASGVARQRLRFSAAGSGLFALVFVIALVGSAFPQEVDLANFIIEALAIVCIICFYIGFAPPRWLRRVWQLAETSDYLTQMSSKALAERVNVAQTMTDLCDAANRSVGGMAAGIVRMDPANQQWELAYLDRNAQIPLHVGDAVAWSWDSTTPRFLRASDRMKDSNHQLLETLGAHTLLITPIITADTTWGLLLVFLKYGSLFIEDDLHFLTLLARQNAIYLENGTLVEQLRDNSTQLEQNLFLTQTLYEASRGLLAVKGYNETLDVIYGYAAQSSEGVASLLRVEVKANGKPDGATVVAGSGASVEPGLPVGSHYPLADLPYSSEWVSAPDKVLLVADAFDDQVGDEHSREIARRLGFRAVVAMPLAIGDSWLGLLLIYWATPHAFSAEDRQFYNSLSTLMTTVLETERLRQAEQQALQKLEEQEAHYRLLAENVSDIIFRLAPGGVITYVSSSVSRVLDYPPEELIGHKTDDFIHPDDLESIRELRKTNLQMADDLTFACRLRHRDGHYVWTETTSRMIGGTASQPEMVAATRDISKRRAAEEAVQKLNAELDQRARALTEANRELEAFSYSVSHDLRAPLRAIDGFSQALLEDYQDKLDADGQNYLQRVRGAATRMSELIDDLLNLSRITRAEMHHEAVDLSQLAQTVASQLQQTQPDRQVDFVIAQGLATSGDSRLLRVVFDNLLGNAWKFTSKHPRTRIEVGCKEDSQEGRVFFVRDDGDGFDMAYVDRLFGAFQRLHAMTEFEGTGIGLATVQRIIRRHNGRIWAEGAVGQGATFYFTLRAA